MVVAERMHETTRFHKRLGYLVKKRVTDLLIFDFTGLTRVSQITCFEFQSFSRFVTSNPSLWGRSRQSWDYVLIPVACSANSRSVNVTKAYPMLRASFTRFDIESAIVIFDEQPLVVVNVRIGWSRADATSP